MIEYKYKQIFNNYYIRINVARLAHIPSVVIENAKIKSRQIQEKVQKREREIKMIKKLQSISRK